MSKFMETYGLNFREDELNPELFEKFIDYLNTEYNGFDSAYEFNEEFLKINEIDKKEFLSFMKSIGLKYKIDKINDDVFDQYTLFKEEKEEQERLKKENKLKKQMEKEEQERLKKEKKLLEITETIRNEHKIEVQIPQKVDKTANMINGAAVLGKSGAILGGLGPDTQWTYTDLVIGDFSLSIPITGQTVSFEEIINYGIASDDLFTITSNIGNNMSFRIDKYYAKALNIVLNEKIPKKSKVNSSNGNNEDLLLKYAELYEKGLLTKEEFEIRKSQIIYGNDNVSSSNTNLEKNLCPKCGNELEPNSKFCSNCGLQLKD